MPLTSPPGTACVPPAWIERTPAPYFKANGHPWHPIGQNDAVTWLEWRNLQNIPAHLNYLKNNGVTCVRLMLEYAETGQHFFEHPAGTFNKDLVAYWDQLFPMLAHAGIRVLLTPMDTYFHWVRWDLHPYNTANGGPCPARTQLMTHPGVRALIKSRLEFATTRWGGTGTIFAWDLWNEMHPVQGEDHPNCFDDYIADVGPWLRALETNLHGRAHLQTVSVFGPELHWKPWLNKPIFRHPALDFANTHFYDEGTIDDPADTVAPARAFATLMAEALAEITDDRPLFDTEHGPIHTFKDRHITLPDAFDNECFRHCQWVHLACGGAGGGMRWPNRNPHRLTPGMRRAQFGLSTFLPLIDWHRFHRRLLDLDVSDPEIMAVGCGDTDQAILWLLRTRLRPDGRVDGSSPAPVTIWVPGLGTGNYRATLYDTVKCRISGHAPLVPDAGRHRLHLPALAADCAVAVAEMPAMWSYPSQ